MPLLKAWTVYCCLLTVLGVSFLHVGKAVKRFKKKHLTADDCKALAQTAEGSSSLTQPLRQSRKAVNRGLHPTHRTRRHQGGTLMASTSKAKGFGGEKG